MIATRILNVNLEIAEIIEVKVGIHHLGIQKDNVGVTGVPTLTSQLFLNHFLKFLWLANFQGCSTKVGSSSVCAPGPKTNDSRQ